MVGSIIIIIIGRVRWQKHRTYGFLSHTSRVLARIEILVTNHKRRRADGGGVTAQTAVFRLVVIDTRERRSSVVTASLTTACDGPLVVKDILPQAKTPIARAIGLCRGVQLVQNFGRHNLVELFQA